MNGNCWTLPALLGNCYQQDFHFSPMASVTKKSRSKYWFACFRDLQGKQRRVSTKQTDRKKAMKVAEQYEQISQRKLPVHTVRQTLTALAREAYGETFPSATVRNS